MALTWESYFDYYLDGKPYTGESTPAKGKAADDVARNATTEVKDGVLHITPSATGRQDPFLALANLKVAAPAVAKASIRTVKGGKVGISWRREGPGDFLPEQMVLQEVPASPDFQEVTMQVPAGGPIIHIRLHLPPGSSELHDLSLKALDGTQSREWSFRASP